MPEGLRTRLASAVVVLALLLFQPTTAAGCSECLRAGAASVPLRLPLGTPVAGYGSGARRLWFPDILGLHPHAFWFKPHGGELDQLMTRALVVENASARVVFVTLDVVAVDRNFAALLRQRVHAAGPADGTVLVAASHTRSGPGAFLDSALMGFVAVDRPDERVRSAVIDAVAEAVWRADAAKRRARIGVSKATVPGLTVPRLDRAVDPELIVVKLVDERSRPIALVELRDSRDDARPAQ